MPSTGTRRLSLTEAGQSYLSRVRNILQDIDEADAVTRKVIETHAILVASPAYLQRWGAPRSMAQALPRRRWTPWLPGSRVANWSAC
ncbi:hypothetical protein [Comamonas endophytica]|uniref:LysR family transcriptional regulator n=1 Tax=Comamonas endophytica TaxID=2949090 RepID=A0ABY6GHX8_9BURK|nr:MULTISPECIES: hypothetical protein [unclassified Acidovorax]MCD2513308.1 hypothetical protein [Acidovorax sp. D4N7]UYG53905.1 hypothetical protein M9799_18410 [Acidovorax sp. 5MLIR]